MIWRATIVEQVQLTRDDYRTLDQAGDYVDTDVERHVYAPSEGDAREDGALFRDQLRAWSDDPYRVEFTADGYALRDVVQLAGYHRCAECGRSHPVDELTLHSFDGHVADSLVCGSCHELMCGLHSVVNGRCQGCQPDWYRRVVAREQLAKCSGEALPLAEDVGW